MANLKKSCLAMFGGSLLFALYSSPLGPSYEDAPSSGQAAICGRSLSELSLLLGSWDGASDSTVSLNEGSSIGDISDDYSDGSSISGSSISGSSISGSSDDCSVLCCEGDGLSIFSCEPEGHSTNDHRCSGEDDCEFKFDEHDVLPYGYLEEDIDRSLSNQQLLEQIPHYLLLISKKDAFIGFYYYLIYLNRCYSHAMQELKLSFAHMAKMNRIPYDVQIEYWHECKRDQMKTLRGMEEAGRKNFKLMVKGKAGVILTSRYFKCLILCQNLWKKVVAENREKWMIIFQEAANGR
ncbi:unnamed protein product [Plasmodium vivax]|uniref:(malaria parasite P. vivax) hypothetical protein n=1 Tax=Plasmodium vivax TaxID=5855 RepID=A0A8S4HB94_PLAVI|nr:unnamed protein product [Plasmodium vivax]